MLASNKTIELVHEVLKRHLSPEVELAILTEICDVPGNHEFRATMALLREQARRHLAGSQSQLPSDGRDRPGRGIQLRRRS
jgi:hypothetical protein